MRDELLTRRIGLVREIVEHCGDVGKTKIQKITYFLQEAHGIPLVYPFRMHFYGPYSDELDGVLSLTSSLGYIDINPDPNGYGYHVTPVKERVGMPWQGYDRRHDKEVKEYGDIARWIKFLGKLDTPKIELYATIHFIGGPKGVASKEETLTTVKRLKPKFTEPEIRKAYHDLEKAKLIQAPLSRL